MPSVSDIRSGFLEFFRRNGHEVRPSSSLVPQNDPTLMFTNAGMNQFKNVFTGAETLPFSRAATSQKCVRAGGKHNDLDNVGYTARHHTFFEMLGNFSFGDYFKEEAIRLAWELLTKDYGIAPNKLTFTVYHTDDEAFGLWKKITGCDDRRILRVPTKDNFWSMGDTGPCGPCSEIFYDHGKGNGEWALNPDGSDKFDERFVEIWNLVFMQFDQLPPSIPPASGGEVRGGMVPLPKPSIDTGMGLERISAVLQGVHDNYQIDLFRNLIRAIEEESGFRIQDSGNAAAYKVIADHLRSSCFLIADGVLPSNEGRGYVLRRIMRRAMRYAHQLGCKEPLMHRLVPALIKEMGGQYAELERARAVIIENLRAEEERFKETLERGLKLLEEETQKISQGRTFPGEVAFKLYDTYGFPLDLTQDILRGRGIGVDTARFEECMEGQRDMARAAHKGSGDAATGKIWFELKEKIGTTAFLGYDDDEADGAVLAIVKDGAPVESAAVGDEVFIVLDKTPFYGESGGQVGDTGQFTAASGQRLVDHSSLAASRQPLATILDTQKPIEDFIVHKAKLSGPLKVRDRVHAAIDRARRERIRANHSATHLLHKALRDALGAHVTQKGSLVAPDRLRFDISHGKPVSKEEIAAVERAVNEVIARDTPVACEVMAPDDAINAGAMALFGEKYGDKVRVLSMGTSSCEPRSGCAGSHADKDPAQPLRGSQDDVPYSVELCGGTHARRTGDIQQFKITSEGAVAAGVRRIEAVTGEAVREYLAGELNKLSAQLRKLQADHAALLAEMKRPLPSPFPAADQAALKETPLGDLPALYAAQSDRLKKDIAALEEGNKTLAKTLADERKKAALAAGGEATKEMIGDIGFIGKIFDGLDPKELRPLAENYLKDADIVAVGTNVEGKASIVVGVSKALAGRFSAVTLVQAAVAELGGKGGGGRPEMAQGGGPEAEKLAPALDKLRSLLQ